MSREMSIELKDVHIRGFHGVHDEEAILGNVFIVDLSLSFDPGQHPVTALDQTIDYVALHDLLLEHFKMPTRLLETLAMEFAESCRTRFPRITSINICIRKKHPPIQAFQGSMGIRYTRSFI